MAPQLGRPRAEAFRARSSYEWCIDIERGTEGKVRLRGGMSLGVDVVLCDRDVVLL